MHILALYSIKGGVGKTASAINLAAQASLDGQRVLIWDLDPQAATTFYLRNKPRIRGGGVEKLVKGKATLDKTIRATDMAGLDLLPAGLESREMDSLLEGRKASRLRRVLKPVSEDYDLVILDCPPGLTTLSKQVFSSVDALLVPVVPTTLSMRTLTQLQQHLDEEHITTPLWPFFTLVDRRRKLHQDSMAGFHEQWPARLSANIPYASAVEQMGVHQAPLVQFAPRTAAAVAYRNLWEEISGRL
ncbi:ParA family protein [Kushneria marisflavi]|uniref:Cobyrinic acid a,c-diamide synthase n=1 Tax=Kushneria marisflavi TaxID=157779 RepID=A0A240UPE1_9GAMM|nr:ParA family protein [Kushneria marisflavi]ART62889.1 cobyrinic acid a,c-diamide synthase [Kushneria marisflavi]RKD84892.1 cellulose biosynthesis protein BcsQ [Kushneria marisflavi]